MRKTRYFPRYYPVLSAGTPLILKLGWPFLRKRTVEMVVNGMGQVAFFLRPLPSRPMSATIKGGVLTIHLDDQSAVDCEIPGERWRDLAHIRSSKPEIEGVPSDRSDNVLIVETDGGRNIRQSTVKIDGQGRRA